MSLFPTIAIVPARGGSKGLPGKNLRRLGGLPLVAHSVRFAQLCPEINRCVVSTDSEQIAHAAREAKGDVPFLRPSELSEDSTPMLSVVQHAIQNVEQLEGRHYEFVILLQPTSPFRLPEDVSRALEIIRHDSAAVGVVAVSTPSFNPRVVCVEEKQGYLDFAFEKKLYMRRQDAKPVYRINGMLYVWKRDYLIQTLPEHLYSEPHRILVVPEERAIDIDTLHDFQLAEAMLQAGMLHLPWSEDCRSEFETIEKS